MRDAVEKRTVEILREGSGTRPDLRIVDIDGQRAVVKDFRGSDPIFRFLIGPILVGREARALTLLKGVEGVPELIERIDRYAIATQFIDAPSLPCSPDMPTLDYFDRLSELICRIHARGVVHCDLRSSRNVLMDSKGMPWVVDFAASITRGRGWNPLVNFLFRQFVMTDKHAVLILKRKQTPELLTSEERILEKQPLPFERVGKAIGNSVRFITKHTIIQRRTARYSPPR